MKHTKEPTVDNGNHNFAGNPDGACAECGFSLREGDHKYLDKIDTPAEPTDGAPETIAGRTVLAWTALARRDDCFDLMVPSELRGILAALAERDARIAELERHAVNTLEVLNSIKISYRQQAGFASNVGANRFDWLLMDLTKALRTDRGGA